MNISFKVIMRLGAAITAIITIYIVFFWEPGLVGEKTRNANANIYDEDQEYNIDDDILRNETNDIFEEGDNSGISLTIEFKNIEDRLTLEDKKMISNILSKLSVVDTARVNKLLIGYTEEEIIEALDFINMRLSEDDYRYIEGILSQYLDYL